MAKKDWYNLGNDIRDIVQNAVDSQDFDKLNQTITDAVNGALKSVEGGLKSAGFGGSASERNEWTVKSGQVFGSDKPAKDRQPQRAGTVPQDNEGRRRSSELFLGTTRAKAKGITFAVIGFTAAGLMGLIALLGLTVAFIAGGWAEAIPFIVFLCILAAAGGFMAKYGLSVLGRVKRFQKYIRGLQGKTYADVSALAGHVNRPEKVVRKDLDWMIEKGWFIEGHLDAKKTCLMVTNEVFDEYRKTAMRAEELKRQQLAEEQAAKKAAEKEGISPEVQAVIEEGNAYINRIRQSNDAIPGEEISEKISRMELLVRRIFDRIEQHPENIPDIRKLMEYYLPTTVKLLGAYEELDHQPVQGENILSSRREIEKTLDTLNAAFEKLLDDLFRDTAWDVSTDISVLHTMLAQEGLAQKDF